MNGTVSQFNYGMVTPVVAFLTTCVGSALGLRCTVRSVRKGREGRRGAWLVLGAVCIGAGIWTMHFIAMIGFTIQGAEVGYDRSTTLLSLVVAVAVVSLGVSIVGYRGTSPFVLGAAGVITGLGVAAMHYIGMSGMRFDGHMSFDAVTVGLSVLIAVVASTAALWAAVSLHTLASAAAASAIMGVAVTGMHYTGMAAMSVHVSKGAAVVDQSSVELLGFLLPMIAGPVAVLALAAVIVMFDPDMLLGDGPAAGADGAAEQPAPSAAKQRHTGSWPAL
ncbi:MHYT domain-containing protein [Streptomyces sp. NPDC059785]|uniref:MHYT domain-containing protein n=1 Tax=Streptomyces sp. NPDC059785 TaxID=3346945 RepID=UPI00364E594D